MTRICTNLGGLRDASSCLTSLIALGKRRARDQDFDAISPVNHNLTTFSWVRTSMLLKPLHSHPPRTFVGAIGQAFTSDRFGRRGSILIWSAIFTVGVAIQTGTEFSVVQITIGRFIAGLGVGAMSAIVPRHLLGNGREDEARKVIAELNSVPGDDPLVAEVIEELEFGIKAENEGGKATWLECFSKRNALWKRTGNGMMLQFIQQLNGQNFYCKLMIDDVPPSHWVLKFR
ncbi:substrate transporter [Salix suchowensis]|nr:substrate transporter [Salix suchowensis]